MTPNEHIEWFKRFAAAYLRWSHFNMDRIVSDIVKKHSVRGTLVSRPNHPTPESK